VTQYPAHHWWQEFRFTDRIQPQRCECKIMVSVT
jgi:hypothetical protein